MCVVSLCTCLNAVASDNVLQAIQIDGVKDSYNIILKSDDIAEFQKTVQAPNKIILDLKGIRASKTINTIYNNTSSVDSVVVEPAGKDSIKILIQAANVGVANVYFDSLKTPLGLLGTAPKQEKTDEIVLSDPISSYEPVYQESVDQEKTSFEEATGYLIPRIKKVLKNEKISWMITFGLFAILLSGGMKLFRGKDSDIRIGLSQSLKDREIEFYKNMQSGQNLANNSMFSDDNSDNLAANYPPQEKMYRHNPVTNYGIKAYREGSRNPYVTPEMQHTARPVSQAPLASNSLQQMAQNIIKKQSQTSGISVAKKQKTMKTEKNKTANIDSMKFLESMTKIYEKNGRADLAQGLKTNMKKAKANLV